MVRFGLGVSSFVAVFVLGILGGCWLLRGGDDKHWLIPQLGSAQRRCVRRSIPLKTCLLHLAVYKVAAPGTGSLRFIKELFNYVLSGGIKMPNDQTTNKHSAHKDKRIALFLDHREAIMQKRGMT